jgi:hypothetical protein
MHERASAEGSWALSWWAASNELGAERALAPLLTEVAVLPDLAAFRLNVEAAHPVLWAGWFDVTCQRPTKHARDANPSSGFHSIGSTPRHSNATICVHSPLFVISPFAPFATSPICPCGKGVFKV